MKISKTAMMAAVIGAVAITSVNPASARQGRNTAAAVAGIAGLALGGIIASQVYRPRSNYYEYAPGPAYYYPPPPPPRVYYAPPPYDPAIAYCMRRFKSYDPYSMTYLGYDGYRHYCP